MRITVIAIGSRGDVQPLLALALGLGRVGHRVRFATHLEFEGLVRAYGLEFAPIWGSPAEVVATEAGQRMVQGGKNLLKTALALREVIHTLGTRPFDDSWAACQDAEGLVLGQLAIAGPSIAEKLEIPAVAAHLNPITPTRHHPAPGLPPWRLGPLYNWWGHLLVRLGFLATFRPMVNRWRKHTLGLSAVPLTRVLPPELPTLYGFSEAVIPRPPDWPEWVQITGYWFLPAPPNWQPPAEVVDFLQSGSPPIYIGFGSMRDTTLAQPIAMEALTRTRQRGVVLSESEPKLLVEGVMAIPSMPFDWLFPYLSAVVHHGGMGTCASALHVGVPQVVIPFMGDQPFWAKQMERLGVATPSIPRKNLTPERLATAIQAVTSSPSLRTHSANFAQKNRAEDGVAKAVTLIERYLAKAT